MIAETSNQKVSFYYNKFLALFLMVFGGGVLVIFGYMMFDGFPQLVEAFKTAPINTLGTGSLLVLCLIGCAYGFTLGFRKFIKFTPDLVLDEHGMYEDFFFPPKGFIPWSAIVGVTVGSQLVLDPDNAAVNKKYGSQVAKTQGIRIAFDGELYKNDLLLPGSIFMSLFRLKAPKDFMIINPKMFWTHGEDVSAIITSLWSRHSPYAKSMEEDDMHKSLNEIEQLSQKLGI